MNKKEIIRLIYLYLFSTVGLVLLIIGSVRFVNLGLKTYVFTKADQPYSYPVYPIKPISSEDKQTTLTPEQEEKYKQEQQEMEEKNRQSQRQRTAAESLAMLIIGAPLFFYHWKMIQKDKSLEIRN